jgi:excisionase family DNA binding protein
MDGRPNSSPDSLRSKELMPPIAVTVKQAARLLGTNDKQIRRGIYARELPVVRFGNSYSIAVDDLRAWFNRKKGVL